jgi:hypothetical protein
MRGKSLLGLLIIVLLIFLFVGCTQKGISIEDRIYRFISDLNNTDRSHVYENFHPDTPKYDLIKPDSFWEIDFEEGGIPYNISGLNDGNPGNVTAAIDSATIVGWGPKALRFVMLQYGNDWMIDELYLDGLPVVD